MAAATLEANSEAELDMERKNGRKGPIENVRKNWKHEKCVDVQDCFLPA